MALSKRILPDHEILEECRDVCMATVGVYVLTSC